ncbi:zinc finger protein ZAT9-like [Phragmites australis]|uniref:zinc finger protein ZAT9-like n=1 Tax=Phragmites australis TaxID=29695 RepID=UPI002D78B377|nr:zinc finger protein ZAT9-like [Phragmites australis]
MEKHTCKLCFRRFHNGRALGGHMRSHAMAAAAAYSPASPPLSLASTSSTEMGDEPTQRKPLASCVLRESPKKSRKVGTPEFSGGGVARGESMVVQDGESDTESSRRGGARFAVSRRRSKRARRRAPPPTALDPEQPASSVSDATPEEDVAMSLVMLSRDSWTRSRSGPQPHWAPASSEAEQNNDDKVSFFDDADEHAAARPRSRHQCGVCKKVFRSYQALGGHRASIKKGRGGCVPPPVPPAAPSKAHRGGAPVIHECPFCFRVFDSGQALSGHKLAHMPSTGALAPSPSTPAKCVDNSGSIDLNVPAAMDDDFELSAVYDAEFGSTGQ